MDNILFLIELHLKWSYNAQLDHNKLHDSCKSSKRSWIIYLYLVCINAETMYATSSFFFTSEFLCFGLRIHNVIVNFVHSFNLNCHHSIGFGSFRKMRVGEWVSQWVFHWVSKSILSSWFTWLWQVIINMWCADLELQPDTESIKSQPQSVIYNF